MLRRTVIIAVVTVMALFTAVAFLSMARMSQAGMPNCPFSALMSRTDCGKDTVVGHINVVESAMMAVGVASTAVAAFVALLLAVLYLADDRLFFRTEERRWAETVPRCAPVTISRFLCAMHNKRSIPGRPGV